MKKVVNLLILLVVALILLVQASCTEKVPEKPNIIVIIADDLSYNSIHPMSNNEVKTPNLDELAERGTMFTHTFNMGGWNGAVCIASRTMINTGRFVWRAEQLDRKLEEQAADSLMWSQVLSRAGYETYFSGKWHVKIDPEKIFDNVRHVRPGMPKTVEESYNRPVEGEEDKWSPYDTSVGGFWEGGKHWSEVLGDDAVDYIGQASERDAPFFMYLAFNAPHDPRQSPREYVDMYPEEDILVPESFLPVYPYADDIGCGKELRDARLAPFPRTEYAVRVNRQEYYAIISHMDSQIARMLDAVEKSGKADNTYIFFTADHGLAVGYHGLIGKQNMYDHSVRPPMIVVGPDIPADKKLDMDIYLQDIMPTTLELAGLDIPEYVEFQSMLPYLREERNESSYDAVYGCYKDLQRMIRDDGYKLIAYPYAEKLRLFDIEKDPLEMNDLAEDPEKQQLVSELFLKLESLGKEMDDTLDIRSFFPGIQ